MAIRNAAAAIPTTTAMTTIPRQKYHRSGSNEMTVVNTRLWKIQHAHAASWLRQTEQAGSWGDDFDEWMRYIEGHRIEAVGFGFLTLRRIEPGRTDATPTVVVEDMPDELTDPLGPEVAGWLDRVDWLRAHATDDALLGARLRLADGVVLERYATAGDDGWVEAGTAVARAEGPRWRHEVDEPAAALLAGCRGELPLAELVELLAFAHDRPVDALVSAALPTVRELVRHGLLVPATSVTTA